MATLERFDEAQNITRFEAIIVKDASIEQRKLDKRTFPPRCWFAMAGRRMGTGGGDSGTGKGGGGGR